MAQTGLVEEAKHPAIYRLLRADNRELLGHEDIKTTMIYANDLNRSGRGVRSPADALSVDGSGNLFGNQTESKFGSGSVPVKKASVR